MIDYDEDWLDQARINYLLTSQELYRLKTEIESTDRYRTELLRQLQSLRMMHDSLWHVMAGSPLKPPDNMDDWEHGGHSTNLPD